jgi:hypothetical protein
LLCCLFNLIILQVHLHHQFLPVLLGQCHALNAQWSWLATWLATHPTSHWIAVIVISLRLVLISNMFYFTTPS